MLDEAMSDYKDIFRTEGSRNWCKAWTAVHILRDGLKDWVRDEMQNYLKSMFPAGSGCTTCTTPNALPCPTRNICKLNNRKLCNYHDNPARHYSSCAVHDNIRAAIIREHRFPNNPSWNNTLAENWTTSSWEIAKCFMPPIGYLDKPTADDTDFNGIVSPVINCKRFQNLMDADLSDPVTGNICTKVRNKVNEIRHFENMDPNISDVDLTNYIDLFSDLLNDAKSLQMNPKAIEARVKLDKLKKDTLVITTEDVGRILKDAQSVMKTIQDSFQTAMDSTKINALKEIQDSLDAAMKRCIDAGTKQEKRVEDKGSQVEQRLDDKGSQVEERLDDKGSQVEQRLDDKGSQVEERLDDKGSQVEERLDDKGSQIEERLDDKGSQVEQLLDNKGSQVEQRLDDKGSQVEQRLDDKVSQVEQQVEDTLQKQLNNLTEAKRNQAESEFHSKKVIQAEGNTNVAKVTDQANVECDRIQDVGNMNVAKVTDQANVECVRIQEAGDKALQAGLKKKPATRMCFEADIEWAWAELHGNTAAPSKKICLGTGANEDKQVKTKTMKTRLSDGVKRKRMKVKKTKIVRPVSSNETVEKEKTTTSCCPRKGYERPETMEDFKDDYSDTIEDDSSEMIKKETKNNRRVNVKSTETVEKEITTTPCYPRKGYERPETMEDLKDDYSDTIEDNSSEKVIKRTKNTRPVNIKSIETVEKEKTTTSCCPRKGYERPETMEDLKDDYCDTIEDNSSEKVKTGTKNSYPVNIKSTEMVEKEKTTTPYYPRKGYERPETMEDLKDNYSDTIEDDSSEKVKKETKNVRPVDVNSTVTVEKENTTPCYPRKGYERPETMEDFKDDYSDTIEDDSSEMVKKETKNNRRVNVKSTETVEKEITTPCYPRKGYERPETMEDLKDDYSDTIEDDSSEKVKKETKNARSIKVNSTVTVEKEKTTPYNPRIGYKRPETMEDLKDDYSDTIEDDSSEKVKKGTKNARLVNVMSTETVEKEITTTPCYPRKGYERPETMEDLKDDYSDTIEDDSSKKVKRGTKNSRPVNIKSNETVEKKKTTPCYPRKGYERLETREDLKDNYSDTIEDDSSEKVKKETKNVRPVAVNSTVTVEKENTTPCYPRKGYERPETMEDFKDDYSDTIEDDTSEMVKKETKNNRRVNVKSTETVEKEITTTPCYPRKGYERPETMEDLKDDYSDTIEDDSSEKVKKETKNARSVKVNSTVTVEKEKTTPCNPRIGYKRPETMEDLKDDYSDTIEDDSSEKVKKRTKNACLVNVMSTETVEKEITTTPCYPRKGYERPETMEDLKDDYSDTIEDDSSEKVKRGTKNNRWVKVNSNETVEKEKTTPCYPRKGYERLETMEDLNADSNDTTTIVPDSEGELSEIIDISLDMTEHLLDKDSDTEDSDNSLSEEMIAKNINNRNIYVKKVIKSTMTKNGTSKKTDRLYNSYHCCPYCKNDKMFSNFAQHVLRRHKTETEVQKLEQEKDLKRRSNLIAQLRCRADHEHNVSVELKGKGEILLGRRFTKGTFCLNEYGPCPRCLEWLKTTGFLRHLKNCPAKELCKESQSCLLIESGVLTGRFNKMTSTVLLKETFSIMKQDDVGKVAQDDDLIVTIGNRWMEKLKGNEINRKYYTSSIMRLAARFLIELKKTKVLSLTGKDENTLSDFLRPQHFDLCISAAMTCANQNVEDLEDLGSPSNAIKLGYEIKRLASAKLGYAIRERDSEDKDDCRDFLQLLEMEWGTRVTKLARVILNERKFNEQKNLPLPEDIQKLKDYLNQNLEEVVLEPAYSCYRRACMLVEAKLVSYNRRRPGEIQQIKLRSYERRVIGTKPIDHAMMRDLTKWEKHLLDSQEVVEVRGKTGRGVPVLLPAETKRALQFITNPAVREKVGIRKENPYVFASANLGVIRAYDSLSTVASEGGLQIPGKITSTNLRKYCATISQVLDMSKNQLDWVCEHLGHTVDVHRSHYRARSDIIERVEVAKLLMIQDFGCTKKFVGKRLDDIQFEDVLYNKETSVSEPSAMAPLPEEPSVTIPLPEEDDENVMQGKARADVFNFLNESDEEDVLPDEAKPKNRRKLATSPVVRQKWTDGEEKELQKLFKKQFRLLKCPNQSEVEFAQKTSKESQGLIWKRPRDNIKKKVSNMLKKL